MRVITSKSKNSESFYISKGYINNKGVNTTGNNMQVLIKAKKPEGCNSLPTFSISIFLLTC